MSTKTLVIYDQEGSLITTSHGSYRLPVGIPYLEVEIPNGKRVVGVDVLVTPHHVILEDIPKTETELLNEALTETTLLIAQQQEQIELQNQAISELTMLIAGGNE